MNANEPPTTASSLFERLSGPASEAAWTTFVQRYSPYVTFRCRRGGLQASDVEDVKARVFGKLVSALRKFHYDPARRFRGYLARTVSNTIRDHWRSHRRRPFDRGRGQYSGQELPAAVGDLPDALDLLIHDHLKSTARAVERVRFEVGAEDWLAFYLTAVEELPGNEVADRLGRKRSAVYVAKGRVLAKLRAAVGIVPPDQ